jgi:dihydropyrimidine dehydrogenase (NAD+) subunit PreA
VRAFAGVDIYTGQPILAAFGGYTGPAIKPIVQRLVIETARACNLPISAVGGVTTWQDVVEYIMLGATTVQVASAIMWAGIAEFSKLLRGVEQFMQEQGYRSIEDFRGITLPHVTTVEQVARQPHKVAVVDHTLCTACGLCPKICFYDALCLNEDLLVRPDYCDGCGLCVEICPVRALRLEEAK